MDTLTNLSAGLAQTFSPELSRQWNRKVQLAQAIPITEETGPGAGQNVSWDVEFSGATAKPFSEGLDLQAGEVSQDTVDKSVVAWGQYRSPFQLTNLEINAARANVANADALRDIVGERFIGAMSKIMDSIESDLFAGTGSGTGPDGLTAPTIYGLDTIIHATGSYGALAPATYSEWAGIVQNNGGVARALSLGLLSTTESLLFSSCGMAPDLLVTTPGVYSKYEGLFNATMRTVNDGATPVARFNGSAAGLSWRGDQIVRARRATTGTLYMLNSGELELRVLPFAVVPDGVQVTQRLAVDSNGKDMGTARIPFTIYPLGRTGSSVKFMVEVYCQLKGKRRNALARLTDISES